MLKLNKALKINTVCELSNLHEEYSVSFPGSMDSFCKCLITNDKHSFAIALC